MPYDEREVFHNKIDKDKSYGGPQIAVAVFHADGNAPSRQALDGVACHKPSAENRRVGYERMVEQGFKKMSLKQIEHGARAAAARTVKSGEVVKDTRHKKLSDGRNFKS